ncbi:hypothetical protein D1007_54223 [Hordeum vulgare]|nr:hypothetical protein D1007_54223 [Hordeum vulgare]
MTCAPGRGSTRDHDVEHKFEMQANENSQYEIRGCAPINDDDRDSEEEYERQHNNVGDVEAQVRHKDMDPDISYQRSCVDDSDDEGPVNELDEDGFTEKDAEWYTKIIGRDHKVPLFCDVSLADKAIVDGGMSKTIEARQFPSSTPDEISMSYLRKVVHSDNNKRYTVKCEVERCKWKVNGIIMKDNWWKITAFEHCRPVLSVDGIFLTSKYKGTIMIAMAHDANDQVLPVAFPLVSVENQDN